MINMMSMLTVGAPLAVVLAGYLGDKTNRCKFMRKLTKKSFGIVKLKTKGGNTVSFIKNLDDDTIRINDKTYIILKDVIINEKNMSEKQKITDKNICLEEGVPVIYFDSTSMLPLTIENIEFEKGKSVFATPEQITAIFRKEKAASKAEAWDTKQDKVHKLLMGALFLSFVAAAVGFMAYTNTTQIMQQNTALLNQIDILHTALVNAGISV